MPSIETTTATAAEPPREPRGLIEWFWRGGSLAEARRSNFGVGRVVRERVQRAQLASELAERALDPVEPLRAGPSVALALSLDREAAYWALLAQDPNIDARDLAGAFAAVPESVLLYAAGNAEELAEVRAALVEQTFVDSAGEPLEHLTRKARSARAFVDALLRRVLTPEQRAERLLLERWLRTSLLLIAVVFGGGFGARHAIEASRGPDLAAGKPWRTSSKVGDCDPLQKRCLGAPTAILFHTAEEDSPWFEIDLGKAQPVSVVEVDNRSDCCPERAVPLIVEVSTDAKKWKEVARRADTFAFWRAQFDPTNARYVRLRVARRSLLHLEKVVVRAH